MEKRAFKRIPVESSNIKYIGHSYPRRLLEVGFNNGSVYRYKNVNNKIYKELLRADSKGKAFHTLVRGKYPYKQIVNKDGDKVDKEWNKVAMRDFDEFIKTAGVLRTYANALTGKNVENAQRRYDRTVDHLDRAMQISDRLANNRAGAEQSLRDAKAAYGSNRDAIKASLNRTRAYNDRRDQIANSAREQHRKAVEGLRTVGNDTKQSLRATGKSMGESLGAVNKKMDRGLAPLAEESMGERIKARAKSKRAISRLAKNDMINQEKLKKVGDPIMRRRNKDITELAGRQAKGVAEAALGFGESLGVIGKGAAKGTGIVTKGAAKGTGIVAKDIGQGLSAAAKGAGIGVAGMKEKSTRSKLLKERDRLGKTVSDARSALENAANKATKASGMVDRRYDAVLKAQKGIKKAKIGSIAAQGATAAGVVGAAMLGRKVYNRMKNGKKQTGTQPQYSQPSQYGQQPQYEQSQYSQSPQYGQPQYGMA